MNLQLHSQLAFSRSDDDRLIIRLSGDETNEDAVLNDLRQLQAAGYFAREHTFDAHAPYSPSLDQANSEAVRDIDEMRVSEILIPYESRELGKQVAIGVIGVNTLCVDIASTTLIQKIIRFFGK